MKKEGYLPLFETKTAKGRTLYWLYAVAMIVGICLIFSYRVIHEPEQGQVGRHAWIGLFISELWFSLYWLVTQSVRWNPIYRRTFKDRLSDRYEKILPGIDIFVCTADAEIEPPIMVINTVLSVMAYDYPPAKLSVYLSDDGGSELMFYALLEASHFSKYWLPFCRKFNIEPRSPAAYFSNVSEPLNNDPIYKEWSAIKKLYEEMKSRIDSYTKQGHISGEQRKDHKGLREWDIALNKRDHQAIIQILTDGKDTSTAVDIDGQILPTLVYMAREKRPQYHHNFKAGAINALIRVSSRISNSPIILTVDCDMYSNNPETVRDALCFFMDEESIHQIAFVQFPQKFDNLTKDDLYNGGLRIAMEVELGNQDFNGGCPNIGTGCFHRRDTLSGKIYDKESSKIDWAKVKDERGEEGIDVLEETCKVLASCTYEESTQWGNTMGVKYGCAVEDVVTGLLIHCRGWKSVFFNPEKAGFLGVAPTTLLQTLVQYKRWAEGNLQIFLSKHCPIVCGHGRIPLKLQIAYCCWELWAPNGLPTLYYVVVPSVCLLRGISLFPKVSSLWIVPFLWVMIVQYTYSLGEFICCAGTYTAWWNEQRMRLFRSMTSYAFAFVETILKKLRFCETGFIVTPKVVDDDVLERYKKSVMEFGTPSPMFTILATVAMMNLFSFIWGVKTAAMDFQIRNMEPMFLQILLSGLLVLINLPVYEGLFFRKDKGRMPASVTYKSVILALLTCTIALY